MKRFARFWKKPGRFAKHSERLAIMDMLESRVLLSGTSVETALVTTSPAVTVVAAVAPGNDNFANATTISGAVASITATNLGATKEAGEPNHAGNPGGHSIWYNWTAPASGRWTVDTNGSNIPTLLAAYTGSAVNGLTQVAANINGGVGGMSKITFDVSKGTTYRIAVDGANGAQGFVKVNLTLVTLYFLKFAGSGDFLGNGHQQLVRADSDGNWWVTVAQNQEQKWATWSTNTQWSDVMVADFNGDGKSDVAGRNSSGKWSIAYSDGTQLVNFDNVIGWSTAVNWFDTQPADVNGDGKSDIIGRTNGGGWWAAISDGAIFHNSPLGTWSPMVTWYDVRTADINGDGKDDVVGRTNSGAWWAGVSTGSAFTNRLMTVWSTAVTWTNVNVGDFNGDGKTDVIGRTNGGAWWAGMSNGTTFTNQFMGMWSTAVTWLDVRVADFNGDGKSDVMGRTNGGGWWAGLSTGTALSNVPLGVWSTATLWDDIRAVDVNGDGKADIVGSPLNTTIVYASLSNGTAFSQTVRWV